MFNIYQKWCTKNKWKIDITNKNEGKTGWSKVEFIVSGKECDKFLNEAGGHRFQRIPNTEKKGCIQTSTITVAILPIVENNLNINERDLKWEMTSGSTSGGQHTQKNETCVKLIYLPTNFSIICKSERYQKRNKDRALKILYAKLFSLKEDKIHDDKNHERKKQIGFGQRGDKIRTYRFKDGIVRNHIKNKKTNLKEILKDNLEIIH